VSHKPGGRLLLLSARPAVTLATLKRAATNSLLGERQMSSAGADDGRAYIATPPLNINALHLGAL